MGRIAAWFAVVIGVGMIGMWVMFFAAGDVPEVRTEPIRLAFHLAAEGTTAVLLILAGVGLLRGAHWARRLYLLATGMLLYTVIVSPGYFAQLGQWPFVGMFAAFLLGALVSLRAVWAEA